MIERMTPQGIALRLFLTCWLIYTLHFATNTVREIYPALALGDQLSFDVSEYLGLHPDIFELPGRGAYINNNPGASILGAIPYALARPAIQSAVMQVQAMRERSGLAAPEYDTIYPLAKEFYQRAYERGLDVKFGLSAGVMQAFLMAPLSALSAVVMFAIFLALTRSKQKALLLALLYAFATPVFFRTGQLNHNVLQGHMALFSTALLWRPWKAPVERARPKYLLAGLLAGWCVVLDYSGVILLAAIGVYAVMHRKSLPEDARQPGDLWQFTIGTALSLAVLAAYQWLAFGNPILPAQHYMPETTYSGFGYQGMDWPKLDLLFENTVGIRYGLLTSAPILLLVLFPPAWYNRRFRLIESPETWLVVFITVGMLLFTAANQFSRMQFNSGVRHMVPVTPFLFWVAAGVLLKMPKWISIPFALLATYWSWSLAMYRDVEQGLGIFEAILAITQKGPQLPWIMTLSRLGMLPGWVSSWLVLLLAVSVVVLIWLLPVSRRVGVERLRAS